MPVTKRYYIQAGEKGWYVVYATSQLTLVFHHESYGIKVIFLSNTAKGLCLVSNETIRST
jgi:hypothetical protein